MCPRAVAKQAGQCRANGVVVDLVEGGVEGGLSSTQSLRRRVVDESRGGAETTGRRGVRMVVLQMTCEDVSRGGHGEDFGVAVEASMLIDYNTVDAGRLLLVVAMNRGGLGHERSDRRSVMHCWRTEIGKGDAVSKSEVDREKAQYSNTGECQKGPETVILRECLSGESMIGVIRIVGSWPMKRKRE
jgi:hypothetical protein